ncbi:hypothetical protein ACSSV1_006435, partial [Labrenzia sp. MBR-25]
MDDIRPAGHALRGGHFKRQTGDFYFGTSGEYSAGTD